jgi:hypothetical protein
VIRKSQPVVENYGVPDFHPLLRLPALRFLCGSFVAHAEGAATGKRVLALPVTVNKLIA